MIWKFTRHNNLWLLPEEESGGGDFAVDPGIGAAPVKQFAIPFNNHSNAPSVCHPRRLR